jgi:TonB family protein
MASAAKITELLPDTLPEDFGEWDDKASPSTQLIRLVSSERDPGPRVAAEPVAQRAEPDSAMTAPVNLLRGAALPNSAPGFVEDTVFIPRGRLLSPALNRPHKTVAQKPAAAPVIEEVRFFAPRPIVTAAATAPKATLAHQAEAIIKTDETALPFFRAQTAVPKPARKNRPIIAGASAALGVVLAVAMIPLWGHRTASPVKAVATPEPAVTAIRRPTVLTPAVSAPTQPAAAVGDLQHSSVTAPASDRKNAGPSRAQAKLMNDQLTAATRIHMAGASVEQAPPPLGDFAAADLEGSSNNNAIAGVFSSANQPMVQAASPKVVNVPAGVAFGLLIQKIAPVYPKIAKDSQVSGTVVLNTHISKNGTIEDLRVVSGPAMLRQAAVNAVRAWRFNPYRINNQPTEIETTIRVTFSLH